MRKNIAVIVFIALISGFVSGFCLKNLLNPTEAVIGYYNKVVYCSSYNCAGIIGFQSLLALIIDGSTLAFTIKNRENRKAGLITYSVIFAIGAIIGYAFTYSSTS
jgi:hypothetical protein